MHPEHYFDVDTGFGKWIPRWGGNDGPDDAAENGLNWTVRQGEKWVVAGANGSGKSTLLELITGDNVQGYQDGVWLFGAKKGDGVSIWDVKAKLGVISTKFHMECVLPSARPF